VTFSRKMSELHAPSGEGGDREEAPVPAPCWAWTANELPLLLPFIADPNWLSRERLIIAVRRFHPDGPIVGHGELGIPSPYRQTPDSVSKAAEQPFSVQILRHGRWVGQLSGTLNVHFIGGYGSRAVQNKVATWERVQFWKRLSALEECNIAKKSSAIERQMSSQVCSPLVRT
jgi:hypothetical protein